MRIWYEEKECKEHMEGEAVLLRRIFKTRPHMSDLDSYTAKGNKYHTIEDETVEVYVTCWGYGLL
jgi:hypothetical protein